MRLENKVVIITGGSSGIGKAIAEIFVKEGANVIIASRNSKKGNRTANQLGAIFVKTDVTKLSNVKNLIKIVAKKYGKIDILINNAGYIKPTPFEKTIDAVWNKTINTNLKGTYYLIKELLPYMKRQNFGRIINISSIAALRGSLLSAPYAAAKAGVIALTKSLSNDFKKYNILINVIAPGPTDAGMIEKIDKKIISKLKKTKKLNKPIKIANLILSLSESDKTTGQTIIIEGGKTWLDK